MDTTVLVEKQYEEGKKLIEKLDEQGNKYPIILWMNMPEKNDWVLLFGIPKLKSSGSKDIFKVLHEVIKNNRIDISLNDISLTDSTSDICQSLKSMIKTGSDIGKISFFGNFINGQRFPDSILYRVS